MNWLSNAIGLLVGKLGFKVAGRFNRWRGVRKVERAAKRMQAPKPPKGYKPADDFYTPRELNLPEITQADYEYNREQLLYDELREYRDQLTELLTSFDFPSEIVEQISNIELDMLSGADFTRLNGAIDRLERYRLAYEGGYITSDDFDYDYIVNEINSSIPGLSLAMPENYGFGMLGDYADIFLTGFKG